MIKGLPKVPRLRNIGFALALAAPIVGYYEGERLTAYLDPVGIPTICAGITSIEGNPVRLGMAKTQAECDALLALELSKSLEAVERCVTSPVTESTKAALISFAYNVGPTAMCNSTAVKLINSGDILGGCAQLHRWVFAKGVRFKGLENRRAAEFALCIKEI